MLKISEESLINFTQDLFDIPIYRIMSVNYLLEMFKNKQNVLVKPHLWKDPFEKMLKKINFLTPDNKIATHTMYNNIYGQCWSRKGSSDALWRIFSTNEDGVRIKTTARKLFNSLTNTCNCSIERQSSLCFIGKVEYKTSAQIASIIKQIEFLNTSGRGWVEALMYKRTAFSHEREIRIMHITQSQNLKSDIFKYSYNPIDEIDSIIFDFRMPDMEFNKYKKELLQLGFKKQISKSKLYDPPQQIIIKI